MNANDFFQSSGPWPEIRLDFTGDSLESWLVMGVPEQPEPLTHEQLAELNRKLSHMRHEVNNQLSLVVAALELVRFRPEMRDKMLNTLSEQPQKIMAEIAKFSVEFEQTFGITRD
jgi:hypothetical protein